MVELRVTCPGVLVNYDEVWRPSDGVHQESNDIDVGRRNIPFVLLGALILDLLTRSLADPTSADNQTKKSHNEWNGVEDDSSGNPVVEIAIVLSLAVVVVETEENTNSG